MHEIAQMTKPKRPPVNATVPIDNNSPSASALVWHSKHIALGRMQNSALGILAAGVGIRQIEAGTQNIPTQSTMDRCQMVQQWRSSSWTMNRIGIEGIRMQLFGCLKWSCNFWRGSRLCLFGSVFWFFLLNGNYYSLVVSFLTSIHMSLSTCTRYQKCGIRTDDRRYFASFRPDSWKLLARTTVPAI